ncbi:MAG: L-serine ammonia-lyase, iron-sulfur-dependent, subunit alpha [Firmicutes bacterium]|nr:L-serine ammonia-lyase, iron-sulfur-dependent, subunit alpha [Bacillota bacterium]
MESLRELYRIGRGPSSSHTMGPEKAARIFKTLYPQAHAYRAVLYGSLAKTGRGHLTDQAIETAFAPKACQIVWDSETAVAHPNTMVLQALENGEICGERRVESVGGGKIVMQGEEWEAPPQVYPHGNFSEIKNYCLDKSLTCWQYVEQMEGPEIWTFLSDIWMAMKNEIYAGLAAEGELAGGLHVLRKARFLYRQKHMDETSETRECRLVCAYAFAAAEENAAGGSIVTAPTCGSCGVLPAVLLYMQDKRGFTDQDILHALATAGLVGNIIKSNASISGAECGCQAEIGSACSMAAAALAALHGMDWEQIEYAAEAALEHHLGLTCDPIAGLVQIPCIERNAVAAMRALNALLLANFLTYARKISFDTVVKTMYETGCDLFSKYRETGEGGLAKHYRPE